MISNLSKFFAIVLSLATNNTYAQEIDPDALYTDKDHPSASDSNDGRYTADGGTGPFKTIQKLVDSLETGMTGYVRESGSPYKENLRKSGSSVGGITFTSGGTESNPIVLAGYPNERPVVNQELSRTPDTNQLVTGFFVMSGNHITIRNFEITQTNASGILTNPSQKTPGVYVEKLVVDDVHVHHLYGGDNTGGVRLDYCKWCTVKNSLFHDIYDTRYSSNTINSEPYGMHSGVHGFRPAYAIIEHNYFYNLAKAIFQKTPNDDFFDSNKVRYNIIKDVNSAYNISLAGAGSPPAMNGSFYGNIVINADVAVITNQNSSSAQSDGLLIYNNALYNTTSLASISGTTNVEVFNNIISKSNGPVIKSSNSERHGYGRKTSLTYVNHNVYHDTNRIALIDNDANNETSFNTLESWQEFTDKTLMTMSSIPGANSLSNDPQYENTSSLRLNSRLSSLNDAGRGDDWPIGVGPYVFGQQIGTNDSWRNRTSIATDINLE